MAAQLGVTPQEAAGYIDTYFHQYPGIKNYMENTKKFCRDHGFVNTFFGRRCYIPGIMETNKNKRGLDERTCINTPIQGTSADITKIAMVNMHKAL